MNKLSIKNLVEYRRMSDIRKRGFANRLKQPAKPKKSGGNYWVRSLSAISTAYKENDNSIIQSRLLSLRQDLSQTEIRKTKIQYQRNIDILLNFIDFDFTAWRPSSDMDFLSQPRNQWNLEINGLSVQVITNHVFAFGRAEKKQVGAIWFVTWKEGFSKSDLGLYAEAQYRYVTQYYSTKYEVNTSACLVVDVSKQLVVSYRQILKSEIPSLFGETLVDIKSKI